MLSLLERRVLATIAYTDQFSYPLSRFQVWQRLVGMIATLDQVTQTVQKLVRQNYIITQDNQVAIAGKKEVFVFRNQAEKQAEVNEAVAQELVNFVSKLPWVKGVALTGALAMGVARPNDDIDVLIITSDNSLWLTRLLVSIFAQLKGRRRYWWEDQEWQYGRSLALKESKIDKKSRAKWCFNVWLTQQSLAVPVQLRSMYTAYEVCQTKFIWDQGRVEEQFTRANAWVKKYLPNYYHAKLALAPQNLSTKNLLDLVNYLGGPLVTAINGIAYSVQFAYMLPKRSREIVGLNKAYFHPRDTQKLVGIGWQQSINQFKKQLKQLKQHKIANPKKVTLLQPDTATSPLLNSDQQDQLNRAHAQKKKVVLVTGVFDLLHHAHRRFLVQAKMQGDFLVVGLESDARVRQLKGVGRPINNQQKRVRQIANLELADLIFVLPDSFSKPEDHQHLISTIRPHILAVSAHTPHQDKKRAIMEKNGGRLVVVMERDASVSTTQLLQNLAD